MRELRIQSGGRPLRVFYAFDPRRTSILLIGGDKTGNDRFYEELRKGGLMAADRPLCDRMSGRHSFRELTKEFTP